MNRCPSGICGGLLVFVALLGFVGCGGGGSSADTTSAPALKSLSPPSQQALSASQATVRITTAPGSRVRMEGVVFTETTGLFSAPVPLKIGVNTFLLNISTPTGQDYNQTYVLHRQLGSVFSARSHRTGRREVFYLDPAQGAMALTPLSASGGVEQEPDLSEDGQWVVAVRPGSRPRLVRYNLPQALADADFGKTLYNDTDAELLAQPRFSPSGELVLFFETTTGGENRWRELRVSDKSVATVLSGLTGVVSPVYDPAEEWIYFLLSTGQDSALWRVRRGAGFLPQKLADLQGEGQALCPLQDSLAVLTRVSAPAAGGSAPQAIARVSVVRLTDFRATLVQTLPSSDQFTISCQTSQQVVMGGRLPYRNGYYGVTDVTDLENLSTAPRYVYTIPQLDQTLDQVADVSL